MIILIDSNAFISDPHCKGLAWRALVHAAPAWGLRIATTEVVVAEVISKFERFIDARQKELTKLSSSLSQFGLDQVLAQPSAMMTAARDAYPNAFHKILKSCDIEIVKIPAIPHMDLVERATSRRRPCDDNGNGYRDTLNWLILLRMAEGNPDEQIAWISDDNDFIAADGSGLHADLIEDLTTINASGRVSWYRTLKNFVLMLAAQKSIIAGDDLRALADRLQNNSITDYLVNEIIPAVLNSSLDAYQCGLPLETKSARLLGVTDINETEVDLTGSISGDQILAQFSLKATAIIEILDGAREPEFDASSNSGDRQVEATISKTMFFRGIITLDSHGKPLTAELSTIEAAHDDPGRRKWDEALAVSGLLENYATALRGLTFPPDFAASIVPKLPADFYASIVPKLPADFYASIVPKLPADFYKSIEISESSVDNDDNSPGDNDDSDSGEGAESND